jgi:uncharacterized tellurite resistance protein B-like protein
MLHDPELLEPVRAAMPSADEDTVRIVAAIAGLLGAVAYADGVYQPAEAAQVRRELDRIQGLNSYGVATILRVLEERLVDLATVDIARAARALRELADPDLRREVLALLLRLAAADGSIASREVAMMRQITTALGLSQSDYNAIQSEYRDLLEVLKSSGG